MPMRRSSRDTASLGKYMAGDDAPVQLLKRVVWHYGVRAPVRLVLKTLGLMTFLLLRAIQPLVRVYIGKLHHDRIGHLVGNTELFLRRRARHKETGRELYVFVAGEPANKQLLRMIKRRAIVIENPLVIQAYQSVRTLRKDSDVWIDLPFNTNEYDEFNNVHPQLAFTEKEHRRGRALLASMGIEPEMQFVCFHARDKAYLDAAHDWRSREEWAYHDYRDCDVADYLRAAEYLAGVGYFALRMGHIVEKRLPRGRHNRVIDYASEFRTDFGDIYLLAHCKFFLGNNSGPWIVASCFSVPVAAANVIPLQFPPLRSSDLFIPKKLWDSARGRFLAFREILAGGADKWRHTQDYRQAGIEVVENTSEEILALTREMNERLDGRWITTDEDEELQERFRAVFPSEHPCYGFPSRIGAEFLRQNRELLD